MAAWKIFSPLLNELDDKFKAAQAGETVDEKYRPIVYPYGSRGPNEAESFIKSTGMSRTVGYKWTPPDEGTASAV